LSLARLTATPVQNFVVGDRNGNIGWTITGSLPKRIGFDGRLPQSWADGTKHWAGVKAADAYPRVENPTEGIIWTANQRVEGSAAYQDAGDGFPDNGARAGQIRDGLRQLDRPATCADMLAIQLDDRGRFYDGWQELLKHTLANFRGTNSGAAAEAQTFVENWGGRAAPASVGFRLVAGFRLLVQRRAAEPVIQLCRAHCTNFFLPDFQFEQPLWTMVTERPAHLLNRRFASWDALFQDAVNELLTTAQNHSAGLSGFTWGDRIRFQLRHPLSQAAPVLGRWLDFPPEELPGAPLNIPRAQGREYGASERFTVQPGREADGIFHMPGGQSGHFLSPFYQAGHRAWAKGEPTPFLPGLPKYRLTLRPKND
jgi:penicillin amidase